MIHIRMIPAFTLSMLLATANLTAQWLDGYSYRHTLSINHSYIQKDLADFPFYLTISDQASFGSDGKCDKVKHFQAYDISFTDATGNLLKHTIGGYDAENGTYQAWINVPLVSHDTDTELHMYYGNREITSSPTDNGIWPSTYKSVWHLDTISLGDATTFQKDIDYYGFNLEEGISSSIIGQGLRFNGTNQYGAYTNTDGHFDFGLESFFVSGWVNQEALVDEGATPTDVKWVTYSIQNESDDVEEAPNEGVVYLTSSDLEIGRDNLDLEDFNLVGLRYADVTIDPNAKIVSAHLEFYVDEISMGPAKFLIYLVDNDNPSTFGNTVPNRVTDRLLYSSPVAWTPTDWEYTWEDVDEPKISADISELVQYAINGSNWSNGNALAFVIKGVGKRIAEAGTNSRGPKMVIGYESMDLELSGDEVVSSADDAEEDLSGNITTAHDLDFDPAENAWVGVRFENVSVPEGKQIKSAYVEFTAYETTTGSATIEIYAEDAVHSSAFGSGNNELTNRSKTSTKVTWQPGEWTVGQDYQTPDITTLLKLILKDPNWSINNAISLLFKPSEGVRVAGAKGTPTPFPPKLVVEYYEPPMKSQSIISMHEDGGFKIWTNEGGKLCFGIDDDEAWDDEVLVSSLKPLREYGDWACFSAVKHQNDSISLYINGEFQNSQLIKGKMEINVISETGGDAEEAVNGTVYNDHGHLQLGQNSGSNQIVGLVFQNINIPPGAEILSAQIQVISSEASSGNCTLTISGDTSEPVSVISEPTNELTDRMANETSAKVSWDVLPFSGSKEVHNSPDLKDIVQEITNQPGWNQGDGLGFFIVGTGQRDILSYDYSPGSSPTLIVQYRDSPFGSISGQSAPLLLGTDGTDLQFRGKLDEIRISNTLPDPVFLQTYYANITKPDFQYHSFDSQATWIGDNSTDWTDPSNWNTNLIPWDSMDVLISPLPSNLPSLNSELIVGAWNDPSGLLTDLNDQVLSVNCDCFTNSLVNGTLKLTGTGEQLLGSGSLSSITLDSLWIENADSVKLADDLTINEKITFADGGDLLTNSYDITFSKNIITTSITDPASSIVLGTGSLFTINDVPNDGKAVFPVSLKNDNASFAAIELTNKDVSSQSFTLSFCDQVYTDGTCDGGELITSNAINITWDISTNVSSADARFYWSAPLELPGFIRSSAEINHYDGSEWKILIGDNLNEPWGNGIYYIETTGITSFSPFGIGSQNVPLPVELLDFYAYQKERQIVLEWETASEINNDFFTLSKSTDGIEFENLMTIAGSGTLKTQKKYTAMDERPTPGLQYYRLRQTDFDGASKLLKTIAISYSLPAAEQPILFPNPSKGLIRINKLPVGAYQLTVYNLAGKTVISRSLNIKGDSQEATIDFSNRLKNGTYILEVHDGIKNYAGKFRIYINQ